MLSIGNQCCYLILLLEWLVSGSKHEHFIYYISSLLKTFHLVLLWKIIFFKKHNALIRKIGIWLNHGWVSPSEKATCPFKNYYCNYLLTILGFKNGFISHKFYLRWGSVSVLQSIINYLHILFVIRYHFF